LIPFKDNAMQGGHDEKKTFDTGAEIKRIRGERSQQEFADLLEVGRTTIIRYESNERMPDAEFLFKLNLLFGVDPTRVVLGRDSVHIQDQKEIALLANYRAASDDDKRAVDRILEMAAEVARQKSKDRQVEK
jgi:transcriptional regulator with XRE-family HTH domain